MHAAILFSNLRFHKTRPRDLNRRRAVQLKDKESSTVSTTPDIFGGKRVIKLRKEMPVF